MPEAKAVEPPSWRHLLCKPDSGKPAGCRRYGASLTNFASSSAVTKDRLPVFRTEALARVACAAMDEGRRSGGFSLFAYVIINPVRDGLVERADEYRWSSFRCWRRRASTLTA